MAKFNHFSVKFIDVMFGLVLGLGFQWWANFTSLWQYVAFVFVYLDIVDYWVDYSKQVKKFTRREIDLMIDVVIMFLLYLYIYSINIGIIYFLIIFILIRLVDTFGFFRTVTHYKISKADRLFLNTWAIYGAVEMAFALGLIVLHYYMGMLNTIQVLLIFIAVRLVIRFLISYKYKGFYLK